jgi:predicted RNA binding protein YcfA (HicA-like mRNA interferase family)
MRDAKPERLIRALKDMGFVEAGQNKHQKMTCGNTTIVIPIHGIIKRNTVDKIRKDAGIEKNKFYSYKF